MFCPQCQAEYRDGFTVCSDCDVQLVGELPAPKVPTQTVAEDAPREEYQEYEDTGSPYDSAGEDPFCAFWQGEDSRLHAELCAVLEAAGIPVKTVRREDHLFRLSATSALKIGVPFSLYEKAEAAVQEAFGVDAAVGETLHLLPAPEPGAEDQGDDDYKDDHRATPEPAPTDFDPQNFYPEDATAEVWSGEDRYLAEFLVNSIAANEIHCRWDQEKRQHRLLVLPADAQRAREIVREVLDAAPPAE